MPEDFLRKAYYGNTIQEWGTALLIIIGVVVAGKILYWTYTNVLRRLTGKTETKLDDIILDMIEEPIVLAITVAGIWFGINRLNMPEMAERLLANGVQMLLVLCFTWPIVRLLDSLSTHYLSPLAKKPENTLDDQILPIVRKSMKFGVWSIGIVVALNNAGYDVGAVLAGLGIGGLASAMAARDTVSKVFGGFTMNLLFVYYIRKDADILQSQTEVNLEIVKRFGAAKLDFAFPAQTLYTIAQGSQATAESAEGY